MCQYANPNMQCKYANTLLVLDVLLGKLNSTSHHQVQEWVIACYLPDPQCILFFLVRWWRGCIVPSP